MNALRGVFILAVVSFAWASSVWIDNEQEFSGEETLAYIFHCFWVLFAECLVYAGLSELARRRFLSRLFPFVCGSVFCVFNFYTLILIHKPSIASLDGVSTALILAALLAAFFMLLSHIMKGSSAPWFVYGLVVVYILQIYTVFFWEAYNRERIVRAAEILPEHLVFPKFVQRPNVYLISFDAMIPEALAKSFLKIDGLRYVKAAHEEGLGVIKNVFASKVPTKPSLNSLIAMDESYFERQPLDVRYSFATGEVFGPLYALFRFNNYKLQFVYESSLFGPRERAGVDFYGIAHTQGICKHVATNYAFMGYCIPWLVGNKNQSDKKYPEYLFDRIRAVAKSESQWLTLSYIYFPGHTKLSYDPYKEEDWAEYRKEFMSFRDAKATSYLLKLIHVVRENDPNSALIIFGDHGAWMSRGLSLTDVPKDSPFTKKEVYQDHHAVFAAVYPKEFCRPEFSKPYSIIRIGRSLVKCLSGGKDPLPKDYQATDDQFLPYLYQ